MIDIRTGRRNGRWTRPVAAPVGVVALVVLAACGTSTGSAASTSSGTPASAEPSAADSVSGDTDDSRDSDLADYRSCLQGNGVTLPEPPSGAGQGGAPPLGRTPPSGAPAPNGRSGGPDQAPPGVDAQTWASAQEACADLRPTPPSGAAPSATSDS
jgi:hypothetical protein